jgi:hypothetical protein
MPITCRMDMFPEISWSVMCLRLKCTSLAACAGVEKPEAHGSHGAKKDASKSSTSSAAGPSSSATAAGTGAGAAQTAAAGGTHSTRHPGTREEYQATINKIAHQMGGPTAFGSDGAPGSGLPGGADEESEGPPGLTSDEEPVECMRVSRGAGAGHPLPAANGSTTTTQSSGMSLCQSPVKVSHRVGSPALNNGEPMRAIWSHRDVGWARKKIDLLVTKEHSLQQAVMLRLKRVPNIDLAGYSLPSMACSHMSE